MSSRQGISASDAQQKAEPVLGILTGIIQAQKDALNAAADSISTRGIEDRHTEYISSYLRASNDDDSTGVLHRLEREKQMMPCVYHSANNEIAIVYYYAMWQAWVHIHIDTTAY
eukprot:14621-Heterococcus_DN1.PRE.3